MCNNCTQFFIRMIENQTKIPVKYIDIGPDDSDGLSDEHLKRVLAVAIENCRHSF
mgnify:CR=1 FL=1